MFYWLQRVIPWCIHLDSKYYTKYGEPVVEYCPRCDRQRIWRRLSPVKFVASGWVRTYHNGECHGENI